jgi:hypothetical protein
LRTQVSQDPEVIAQLNTADHAKTAEGKRTAMRNYYTLTAQKIEKLDPSLHQHMEAWLYKHLFAEEQHRVRPSKLIESIKPLPGSSSADHAAAAKAAEAAGVTAGTEDEEAAPTPRPARAIQDMETDLDQMNDGR